MKERDHSKISKKFASLLGERIKCLTCKRSKAKFNEELCLSVPLVKGELPPVEYFQDSESTSETEEETKDEEVKMINTAEKKKKKKTPFKSAKYFN